MTSFAKQGDWGAFALLLIDVQRDFWPEAVARHFPQFEERVAQLLAFCRNNGIEVIHLHASFAPDQSDWMVRHKVLGQVPCIRGTAGVEVLPCATALPGEVVIEKQTFDGFQTLMLLPYLHQQGKRFLLTAGIQTSVCVLLTTATAAQMGFLTAVVEDCCADRPERHAQALNGYPFIFERTTTDQLAARHADWLAMLATLDQDNQTKPSATALAS